MVSEGGKCSKYIDGVNEKDKACAHYGIEWFTPDNTFFLKHPNGFKEVKEQRLSIDPGAVKIGSYYLESFSSLGYFRLYNCRKTINFRFDGENYFIHNGIGWKQSKRLEVPRSIDLKLLRAVQLLNKEVVENNKINGGTN